MSSSLLQFVQKSTCLSECVCIYLHSGYSNQFHTLKDRTAHLTSPKFRNKPTSVHGKARTHLAADRVSSGHATVEKTENSVSAVLQASFENFLAVFCFVFF